MKKKYILLLSLLVSINVQADIYKTIDARGRIIYSDTPISKKSKNMRINFGERPQSVTLPAASQPAANPNVALPTTLPPLPSKYMSKTGLPLPKANTTDNGKQQKEEQLANEEKKLDELKKNLEDGKKVRNGNEKNYQKYLDRVQKLNDSVIEQQKRIDELRGSLQDNKQSQ